MYLNNQFPIKEKQRGDYLISTNPNHLDINIIHDYLANQSYWAQGVDVAIVQRSLQYSYCYGVYKLDKNDQLHQVGLARVISDFATFAYLSDVFILPQHQKQGLGKWLVKTIVTDAIFATLRKFTLDTGDAHELYTPFGFIVAPNPGDHMVYRPR